MPLGNHLVDHLLETADFLNAHAPRTNLGKAYRRRAISTAYYAVFHALSFVVTDTLIGWTSEGDLLEPVFRSLDHKIAKHRLQSSSNSDLKAIGFAFGRLQEKRNDADYAPPAHNPSRIETADAIDQARAAVALVERLSMAQRRAFAVSMIAKSR